jgi:methyltransferase (TIGR00027 family)
MREREPSRTAYAAAAYRAAHQVLEEGRIFRDPLALAILGQDAAAVRRAAEAGPARRGMRFFIAARTSFAEAALARGVEERGVRQLVVLGAGLDTFACRNPFPGLRVFEVDHPATQAWKRRRLEEAGIAAPDSLVFAPVDFEREALLDGLIGAGFDPARRTFFTWLGVVPYLTEAAIDSTLREVAGIAGGGEVVFDYSNPPASLSPEMSAMHARRAARVAAAGEPFLSYFDLHARLKALGFDEIEDLGPPGLVARYLEPRDFAAPPRGGGAGPVPDRGGHVVFAATRFAGAASEHAGIGAGRSS